MLCGRRIHAYRSGNLAVRRRLCPPFPQPEIAAQRQRTRAVWAAEIAIVGRTPGICGHASRRPRVRAKHQNSAAQPPVTFARVRYHWRGDPFARPLLPRSIAVLAKRSDYGKSLFVPALDGDDPRPELVGFRAGAARSGRDAARTEMRGPGVTTVGDPPQRHVPLPGRAQVGPRSRTRAFQVKTFAFPSLAGLLHQSHTPAPSAQLESFAC